MTDRRIYAGPVGVVRVFVPRQAAEDRLPQHREHRVPHVLPRAPIVQQILRNRRQSKHVVEFPLRQQLGIPGDLRTVEFQLDRPVETHPESVHAGFTHCIPAFCRPWRLENPLFMRLHVALLYMHCGFHPGNPG